MSHVTVTKVIARLKREGLVTSEPYGPLELTDAGRQLAAKSRRTHEIVYKFLRAIGVSEKVAAIDTEGIEPLVHAVELQNVFADDIVRPSLDRADVLANAPQADDECFRVPAVL